MNFVKMHGTGNDYIYIDCFAQKPPADVSALALRLSDRHFGIGGDGIVLIMPSECADVRMQMFNADGSEGKMCGNAIRCVGKYAYERGLAPKEVMQVETLSGIKTLYLKIQDQTVESVRVNMGPPILEPEKIPVLADRNVDVRIETDEDVYSATCVSMGNPHAVIFTKEVEKLDLPRIGAPIEKHPMFPEQVNTEFVEVLDGNNIRMRVWERGAGETLACGTGACAVVVAATLKGFVKRGEEVTVSLIGGELKICWDEETVWMSGPATIVFEGEVSDIAG